MTNKTKQWFLDRVGKKIFRTKSKCSCPACTHVYNDGLYLLNELHANYAYDNSLELDIHYFDTVEERDNYELKKSKNEL